MKGNQFCIIRVFLFIFVGVFLSACGETVPAVDPVQETAVFETAVSKALTMTVPPPSATFTETVVPTVTPTITITSTPTPETIGSWEPPFARGVITPWGIPVEIWDGIPIMPNAVAGGEEYGGYYYSVEKTISEVRQYYQQELGKAGYFLSAIGEDDRTIKLIFKSDEDQIVISALSVDRDYEKIVFKVKGKKEVFEIPEFHGSWVLIEH